MTNTPNERVTDDDLVLLYYGEHDDPGLAARVARDPALAERFDRLTRTMALAEAWQPPQRGADYGAEVWRRLSPALPSRDAAPGDRREGWWARFAQPRFSFAGVAGFAVVAVVAFLVGRGMPPAATPPPGPGSAATTVGLDPQRLLQGSVAGHLDEVNRVLTEFALAEAGDTGVETAWASDMLVANRLYRRATEREGRRRLSMLLTEIEPLLIEMAYGAHEESPTARLRMQAEARDELLFKVRVMNRQLEQSTISI